MSIAVMFSINKPHTDNIKAGLKTSELRIRPPKISGTYKAYIYETLKNGGCGAVIGEFTAYNENRWRMCVGIPAHLCILACVSVDEIRKYSRNGLKDITEISISDLVIYDKPKELSEFHRPCTPACNYSEECGGANATDCLFGVNKAPQAWCYVEVVA